MPVINPGTAAQRELCFFHFCIFPLGSMAAWNISLPCTNLCADTIVYGLEQWLGAEKSIWVKNNLVPENKLYF